MTVEKIRQFVHSIDFAKLSPAERARALAALAAKLNALPREDRHHARWDEDWKSWLAVMTEAEKEQFIEATLPTDIKQMLDAFEAMPPEKRKKTVDEAVKNLQRAQDQQPAAQASGKDGNSGTNAPGQLSAEATQRMQTLGLKTFYSESSAETKAELAPLLEEVQHQMESGRSFR
ncbi:MAG: hypothetical protein JWQ04_2341 [Pedosphaera sp.]|nr:hypothetical protein [Pedosphaera sp.]